MICLLIYGSYLSITLSNIYTKRINSTTQKKVFSCVMVVAMISSNILQFQYFGDFNKCLQAMEARLFSLKIIKSYYKSSLKVCELKV